MGPGRNGFDLLEEDVLQSPDFIASTGMPWTCVAPVKRWPASALGSIGMGPGRVDVASTSGKLTMATPSGTNARRAAVREVLRLASCQTLKDLQPPYKRQPVRVLTRPG